LEEKPIKPHTPRANERYHQRTVGKVKGQAMNLNQRRKFVKPWLMIYVRDDGDHDDGEQCSEQQVAVARRYLHFFVSFQACQGVASCVTATLTI
jgi:hypothetical protein